MIRIAFIILAYKNPTQLRRLVGRLTSPFAKCYIHIDRRADIKGFQLAFRDSINETSIWLKRERSAWGTFGTVQATINGIMRVLEEKPAFDYIFLLSGQDYPLKGMTFIQDFLAANYGKNFMSHSALPNRWYRGGMERIEYYYFRFMGRWLVFPLDYYYIHFMDKWLAFPIGYPRTLKARIFTRALGFGFDAKKRIPSDLKPYGGSGYWCLSQSAARYIIDFIQRRQDVIRFYKYSRYSDEMFFHTILLNSYLRDSVINKSLHYIDWSTHPAPAMFTSDDITRLSQSDCLFARKFDLERDSKIFDLIDEMIDKQKIQHVSRD